MPIHPCRHARSGSFFELAIGTGMTTDGEHYRLRIPRLTCATSTVVIEIESEINARRRCRVITAEKQYRLFLIVFEYY